MRATLLALLALPLPAACGKGGAQAPGDTGGGGEELGGPDYVLVPPGRFTMGSPEDEVGRDPGEEQHEVELTHSIWVAVRETTRREFEELMGYDPSFSEGCPDCPVDSLSWHEAATYANALSESEGLEPCYDCEGSGDELRCRLAITPPHSCPGYRLPTSAEWEYAARAGTTSAFSSGGGLPPGTGEDCEEGIVLDDGTPLDEIAWTCGHGGETPHAVGLLEPNPWGLHDVHGNAWEWCSDGYDGMPHGTERDPWSEPAGLMVARGGSWHDFPSRARSAAVGTYAPGGRYSTVGLRLVRTRLVSGRY